VSIFKEQLARRSLPYSGTWLVCPVFCCGEIVFRFWAGGGLPTAFVRVGNLTGSGKKFVTAEDTEDTDNRGGTFSPQRHRGTEALRGEEGF
jgi:hypothetical protein